VLVRSDRRAQVGTLAMRVRRAADPARAWHAALP
jgi:hypothetical protein